jgi:amino acid transporter
MIGSGIFVLPGLAFELGGPSMILAYLLAGVIVFPAALAQSEMATAMPRAGGAYLYIDMAMGPLMGTIAGFGVWLSLVFKAAFALDGLGLYLGWFTDFDELTLGLMIGVGLLVINLVGIKESGRIQAILVTVVFAVLLIFIGGGATFVDSANYHPFFPAGVGGLFATAGLVFVSYAGVTNVASVAEEVSNPARTLPVAIIASLLVMMFIYPAVTYVMVGVTPSEVLSGNLTPLATATEQVFPDWVATVVAVVGVLALATMANAGLLASSRYPFAMARRRLVPSVFTKVGARSGTPTWSLILTGGLLLGLVAFLPVFELAKLASAFLALVLALICVAQIAFRSSNLWWYRPKFHAPGYPWVPLIGVGACLFLITQLGAGAILGALGIIVGGVIWYQVYGRSRAIKENAFRESVRQQGMARLLQLTEEALADDERRITVVSGREGSDSSLFRIGRPMAGSSRDSVNFLHPGDDLVNRIAEYDPDLLVGAATRGDGHGDNLPADRDVALLTGDSLDKISRIDVLGSGGPYDVLKICLAAKIAEEEGASIRFVHVLDPAASNTQVRALEKFHEDLGELVNVATESMVIQSEDLLAALTSAVDDTDLAIIGAPRGRHFFTDLIDRIVERVPAPVLLVRVAEKDEPTTIRNVFHRFVTNRLGK